MRLLLDTCTFLWAVDGHARLTETAREAIANPDNEVYLSAVSAWEIAVEQARGNLTLSEPAPQYVPRYRKALGVLELPLDEPSALQVGRLPAMHKDPFDRMLAAQAEMEKLQLITIDPKFKKFGTETVW